MNSHPSFWSDPQYSPRPPHEGTETTDILIIGGGITGVSAALSLAEAGHPPVLLEKERLASGASGRNAGFLIAGTAEYYHRVRESLGRHRASMLWRHADESHEIIREWSGSYDFTCGYERTGSLVLAGSDSEFREIREAVRSLNADGFDAELVSSGELHEWGTAPETFAGGYFVSSDGVVNPAALVRELAMAAERRGARISEDTEVLDLSETTDGSVRAVTHGGTVEAQIALVTTNAYLPQLNILDGIIFPVRGQMLATEELPPAVSVPCYANFGYEYFRQIPDGRLLVGGMRQIHLEAEATYDLTLAPGIQSRLNDYVKRLLRQEKMPNISHRWAGIMGFSTDGLPVIGHVMRSNRIFIAAGFTGHGMSLAPKIASMVSTILIEGAHPEASLYSIRRFLN